jgi:hypothetical protein
MFEGSDPRFTCTNEGVVTDFSLFHFVINCLDDTLGFDLTVFSGPKIKGVLCLPPRIFCGPLGPLPRVLFPKDFKEGSQCVLAVAVHLYIRVHHTSELALLDVKVNDAWREGGKRKKGRKE